MSSSLTNPKLEAEVNGPIVRSNTIKSQSRGGQMQGPGSFERAPAPAGALGSVCEPPHGGSKSG